MSRVAVLHGISSMGVLEEMSLLMTLAMPNTQIHTYQSCSFLDRRLFLGSMREHHLLLPWTELTDPPFWELLVAVSTNVCAEPAFEEQHVPVSDHGIKEEISFLFFTFYFLF